MSEIQRESFLDRPIARVLAGGVIAIVIAVLAAQHWDDLFPPEDLQAVVDQNDPVAVCTARERAQIEQLVAQNPGMAAQRDLFLQRAEARCQATAGGNAPGGGSPGGGPTLPAN